MSKNDDFTKEVKRLEKYNTDLERLVIDIRTDGSKVKIGKFKIVETPSVKFADRLAKKLSLVAQNEMLAVGAACKEINKAIVTAFQENLFVDETEE